MAESIEKIGLKIKFGDSPISNGLHFAELMRKFYKRYALFEFILNYCKHAVNPELLAPGEGVLHIGKTTINEAIAVYGPNTFYGNFGYGGGGFYQDKNIGLYKYPDNENGLQRAIKTFRKFKSPIGYVQQREMLFKLFDARETNQFQITNVSFNSPGEINIELGLGELLKELRHGHHDERRREELHQEILKRLKIENYDKGFDLIDRAISLIERLDNCKPGREAQLLRNCLNRLLADVERDLNKYNVERIDLIA